VKTYLLSFNAGDFSKAGKVWTSDVIDLYSNKYYTNYSLTRSFSGLNSLGDYTFTGTELLPNATPTIAGAHTVTNYGEIITDPGIYPHYIFNYDSIVDGNFVFDPDTPYDPLNPSTPILTPDSFVSELNRFVDTSSRIDIRTFKGAFSTNLNSVESITFDLKIYESDSENRTMAIVNHNHI